MDIYTKNGILVRHFPNADGTTIVETRFLFEKEERAEIYCLTACYNTFYVRMRKNFVLNVYSGKKVALMLADFTEEVQESFVQSLIQAREKGDRLFFLAKEEYFNTFAGEAVKINCLAALEKYKNCELRHGAFWEKCSRIINEV